MWFSWLTAWFKRFRIVKRKRELSYTPPEAPPREAGESDEQATMKALPARTKRHRTLPPNHGIPHDPSNAD